MLKKIICLLKGHDYKWEYIEPGSCNQVYKCQRDGDIFSRRVFHDMGPWDYVASDSCEMVRVCIRDGYTVSQEGEHLWSEQGGIRTCQRCKTNQERVSRECYICSGSGSEWIEETVEHQEWELCMYCGGAGDHEHPTKGLETCSHCDGEGSWQTTHTETITSQKTCHNCEGAGHIESWVYIK
jgi:DnaJ-class molecular chaperone